MVMGLAIRTVRVRLERMKRGMNVSSARLAVRTALGMQRKAERSAYHVTQDTISHIGRSVLEIALKTGIKMKRIENVFRVMMILGKLLLLVIGV